MTQLFRLNSVSPRRGDNFSSKYLSYTGWYCTSSKTNQFAPCHKMPQHRLNLFVAGLGNLFVPSNSHGFFLLLGFLYALRVPTNCDELQYYKEKPVKVKTLYFRYHFCCAKSQRFRYCFAELRPQFKPTFQPR